MPSHWKDERSPGLTSTLKLNCWSQKLLKSRKPNSFEPGFLEKASKRIEVANGQSFPYREVFYPRVHVLSTCMLAGRTSTDSLTTSDSNRNQNPRMLTRQYGWQHPRANLLIQLETRPGKITPTGCSLSYTQAGILHLSSKTDTTSTTRINCTTHRIEK